MKLPPDYEFKQTTDVKLRLLYNNTWNPLTVRKKRENMLRLV